MGIKEDNIEELADLGRAVLAAIAAHAPRGWHPAECPSEIVGDLRNECDELRADAERYAARRKSVFLTQQRLQISGPRMTEAEFNANYDKGCDKNLAGYVTDHRGVWVKDEAMTLRPNAVRPDHKPENRQADGGKAY